MCEPLLKSMGANTPVTPIYFGVDERWYNLAATRRASTPRKWLVVSRVTRKKLGRLLEWGRHFTTHEGDELHLLGPMQEQVALPGWINYHGPTNPDELSRVWFPAATALVTLSNHSEGLPQVILEAMAAGIPVIASRIPGHEAAISGSGGGWLVDSEQQLIEAIATLRIPARNAETGRRAHRFMRELAGSWDDCAGRFVQSYKQLLKQ